MTIADGAVGPSSVLAAVPHPGAADEPIADVPGRIVPAWFVELSATVPDDDLALLDSAEKARAAGYVRAADGARFAGGRVAVRRLIAGRLGVDPATVALGRRLCPHCGDARHGPPSVVAPDCDLTFSLARTGRLALVAIAEGFPVGVDVEGIRSIDVDLMAQHCLSPAERAYLGTLTGTRRLEAFYRCWTRKEAVTKAGGVGIAVDLGAVDTAPEIDGRVAVRHQVGHGPALWEVHDLPLPAGLAAAVAWPAGAADGARWQVC